MNHGLKVNGNILEIALPEEVHIDKVIVNRKIFSQRQRVCESCKYHGLEGHEEPCVSCEVGNSNYVPSVEQEEHTEEHTETHACDCVSRQAAIDIVEFECGEWMGLARTIIKAIEQLPSAQPKVRTEEHTETHACDCVGRQAAIDVAKQHWYKPDIAKALKELPSVEPEVIRCKDCKYGVDYYHEGDCYCSNPKSELTYFGGSWEFYCADAERRDERQ